MKNKIKKQLLKIFFKKIALVQSIVYIFLFITLGSIASWYLKQYILKQTKEELTSELSIIKYFFERPSIASTERALISDICSLKSKTPHIRITIINSKGDVLCDSDFDTKNMANHLNRPEIIHVKNKTEGEFGYAEHFSETLSMKMLYGATIAKMHNQNYFLRIAIPIKDIDQMVNVYYHGFFIFVLPLLIFGPLIGLMFIYRASGPTTTVLERLNIIINKSFNERPQDLTQIGPLDNQALNSLLNQTEKNIEHKINELTIENAKLNALMQSTEDPIVAIDSNESIWFANDKFRVSFLNASTSINRGHEKLRIKDIFRQHPTIKKLFLETISSGKICSEKNIILFSHEDKGHTSMHFDLNIGPIVNTKSDKTIGALGVFHNITERILSEQMKEEFVCNISHEVRTPLSSIKGFFQLFKQGIELTPDLSLYAKKIERGLDRVVALFDDLLKLSSIEGKSQLNLELLSTFSVTEDVLSLLAPIYVDKKITVTTHIEKAGENVWADGALLENLLTNLIDNAYKYTENSGAIDILWRKDPTHTILEVKDTGVGISLGHQDKIFEKFYRVDINRSRNLGGTGLGLSIVKQIVSKHNALIEIESTLGVGTTFRIKFPNAGEATKTWPLTDLTDRFNRPQDLLR